MGGWVTSRLCRHVHSVGVMTACAELLNHLLKFGQPFRNQMDILIFAEEVISILTQCDMSCSLLAR